MSGRSSSRKHSKPSGISGEQSSSDEGDVKGSGRGPVPGLGNALAGMMSNSKSSKVNNPLGNKLSVVTKGESFKTDKAKNNLPRKSKQVFLAQKELILKKRKEMEQGVEELSKANMVKSLISK